MGAYARESNKCRICQLRTRVINSAYERSRLTGKAAPTAVEGEKKDEKNLPTQEKTKKQSARIPRKNEDHRWPQNACKT